MTKSGREIMEIFEAFDLTGQARHPRLHRHRPQARPRRLRSPVPAHDRKTLAAPSPADLPVTTRSNQRHHHRPSTGVNTYPAGPPGVLRTKVRTSA